MAAIPHSTSGEKPNRLPPPELDDAEYVSEVLRLQEGQTEEALDAMILREAESLGVPTTRPRPVPETASAASSTSQATASASRHGRNGSTATNETASTALTAYSTANDAVPPWSTVITSTTISSNSFLANPSSADASNPGAVAQKRSKSLSFSQYDKYLAKLDPSVSLTVSQPKFLETPPPETKRETAPSIFSAVTRKSYFSIKKNLNLKLRFSKKSAAPTSEVTPCVCCREDFAKTESIQRLPCGHSYCSNCLRIMAKQASVDESKMPPRCCAQPIPGHIVKAVLANSKEEQQAFLKAVEQFATPWESRIFCPNKACGDFIPPRQRVDPKNPFSVACRRCRTRVCIMCKRDAHRIGQDCPEDYELEAVLKIGENAGWRRCYKCRTLVELTQGCTHMTCR